MKKEDVLLLAQLLHVMKDVAEKIEQFYKEKNFGKLDSAKKEMLSLQGRVNEVL